VDTVYHLVSRADWDHREEPYVASSLAIEGFIHCSFAPQLDRTVARHFAGLEADLLVIELDPESLDVRVEDSYGSGESFPHVYGPIPGACVRSVKPYVAGVVDA
jgi:uncharacterized protein (DUF952 family)